MGGEGRGEEREGSLLCEGNAFLERFDHYNLLNFLIVILFPVAEREF